MNRNQQGFTFIEILIALIMLASSFTIIIGLQTAAISATVYDSQMQKGLLIARTIMSYLEVSDESISNMNKSGNAISVLESIAPNIPNGTINMREFQSYQAELIIEYWNVELLAPNSLQRVMLKVWWGQNGREQINLDFFIPVDVTESPEE